MELEPYLHLNGRCEEALKFYATVFGGEIVYLGRYEGSPVAADVPDDYKQKVMHASFESPALKFMASDPFPGHERAAGNVTLSLATNDPAEAERVFNALADGGTVGMPLGETFWAARFGMLVDRFGISWMMNCGRP
jgi:PhnB protein